MTDVLEAPLATPPRVSLLSSAEIVPVEGSRWESGFSIQSEGCEVSYTREICPPADAEPKDNDGAGETVDYVPYVVFATDKCSTFPARREFYNRAQRKLILAESFRLERELWLDATGSGNPSFNDGTAVTLSATGSQAPYEGIAILDQGLAECSSGRGMIHLRAFLLPYLLDHKTIRREGNVYLSPMDNIVVPGRGYPGSGPAGQNIGATEWMFANTGIVVVRHSEIIFNPPKGDNALRESVTRSTNDRVVYAERVTHVALDPTCCVFATEVASLAVS